MRIKVLLMEFFPKFIIAMRLSVQLIVFTDLETNKYFSLSFSREQEPKGTGLLA